MDRQAYQTTVEAEDPNKDRFKYNPIFLRDKHGMFKLIEASYGFANFCSLTNHVQFYNCASSFLIRGNKWNLLLFFLSRSF